MSGILIDANCRCASFKQELWESPKRVSRFEHAPLRLCVCVCVSRFGYSQTHKNSKHTHIHTTLELILALFYMISLLACFHQKLERISDPRFHGCLPLRGFNARINTRIQSAPLLNLYTFLGLFVFFPSLPRTLH